MNDVDTNVPKMMTAKEFNVIFFHTHTLSLSVPHVYIRIINFMTAVNQHMIVILNAIVSVNLAQGRELSAIN